MSEKQHEKDAETRDESQKIGRRSFLAATVTAAAVAAAYGQIRDYKPDAPPVRYPDKDIIVLDKRFTPYVIRNAPIQRLYTGTLWAEGTAWNSASNYLVWSD